jgi:hypothetical protein
VNTAMCLSDPKMSRNYPNCEDASFTWSMKLGNSGYWGPDSNAQQEPVIASISKGKRKVHPITGHEGPEGE